MFFFSHGHIVVLSVDQYFDLSGALMLNISLILSFPNWHNREINIIPRSVAMKAHKALVSFASSPRSTPVSPCEYCAICALTWAFPAAAGGGDGVGVGGASGRAGIVVDNIVLLALISNGRLLFAMRIYRVCVGR